MASATTFEMTADEVIDSDGDLVFLARTAFDLEYTGKHNEDIVFSDVKDIHRR